jgi:hypothetical protein
MCLCLFDLFGIASLVNPFEFQPFCLLKIFNVLKLSWCLPCTCVSHCVMVMIVTLCQLCESNLASANVVLNSDLPPCLQK